MTGIQFQKIEACTPDEFTSKLELTYSGLWVTVTRKGDQTPLCHLNPEALQQLFGDSVKLAQRISDWVSKSEANRDERVRQFLARVGHVI